jgi:PKD repeat protein
MLISNFVPSGVTGSVYVSEFIFIDTSVSTYPIVSRYWDFGDNTYAFNDIGVKHRYNYPGNYTVGLSVADIYGTVSYSQQHVSVDYVVRDRIVVTQIPPSYSLPGIPTPQPFKVSVTSAQINQPLFLQFHAANSRSLPYEIAKERWNFLTPTWRFLDKNYNTVTTLSVEPIPIYSNGAIAGSRGEAEFYYVDDLGSDFMAGDCALLLTITLVPSGFHYPLETQIYNYPSYANSNVCYATVAWQVDSVAPEYLKITGNYLDKIDPIKWPDVKIPVMITAHSSKNTLTTDLSGKIPNTGILFSHPKDNITGKNFEVVVTLSGVPLSAYTVDEAPLYFQQTDKDGLITGGYIFTTVTPHKSIPHTAIIATVSATLPLTGVSFQPPYGYTAPPFVWVSNPEHNTLQRITVVPATNPACSALNVFSSLGGLAGGAVFSTAVPILSVLNTSNYALSGFSGIYGLAIDTRNNDLIAADAETDTIYRFNSTGNIVNAVSLRVPTSTLQTINGLPLITTLSSTLVIGYDSTVAFTPSYVSLDKNYNIWVSFFDSVSVAKFDENFNFLLAATPSNNEYQIDISGDWLFKPPVVETDLYNNIWVTYAQVLCSAIFKYDTYGNQLLRINLPSNYLPIGITVTPTNGIWVTNSMHTSPLNGNLQHYDSNGILQTTISGFTRPSYISLDRQGNVWFTHGFREIGYINSLTHQTSSWTLSSNGISGCFVPISIPDPTANSFLLFDEEIGGLTVDAFNRLWVIDSQNNIVFTLSASPFDVTNNINLQQIFVYPSSNIGFAPNILTSLTVALTSNYYKSAQATGDWSGNKWLQKYGATSNALQGVSTPFAVLDYDNMFAVKKQNENFNTSEQYYSLALPEILQNNDTLFNKFLPAVVGTSIPDKYEDIGEKVYERIANFIEQHADVETCGIDQLISLCKQSDVSGYEYLTSMPASLKRALDIFSIPKERLRGTRDSIPVISKSVGDQLNTLTDILTAGQKIFLQNKFSSVYTLITVPVLSGVSIYPLSAFDGTGFSQPVLVNYQFFKYTPYYPYDEINDQPVYIENIIDWNNPYTTLNYNLSTYQDWYGDSGLVEKVFNYLLTKNIFEG